MFTLSWCCCAFVVSLTDRYILVLMRLIGQTSSPMCVNRECDNMVFEAPQVDELPIFRVDKPKLGLTLIDIRMVNLRLSEEGLMCRCAENCTFLKFSSAVNSVCGSDTCSLKNLLWKKFSTSVSTYDSGVDESSCPFESDWD